MCARRVPARACPKPWQLAEANTTPARPHTPRGTRLRTNQSLRCAPAARAPVPPATRGQSTKPTEPRSPRGCALGAHAKHVARANRCTAACAFRESPVRTPTTARPTTRAKPWASRRARADGLRLRLATGPNRRTPTASRATRARYGAWSCAAHRLGESNRVYRLLDRHGPTTKARAGTQERATHAWTTHPNVHRPPPRRAR